MAYSRDLDNDLVWDEDAGRYVPAPRQYTLTIVPVPADATVTLTAAGYVQSGNSITVYSGTSVSYSVSKTGFTTKSDTVIVSDSDLSIRVRIWPVDNALHIQLLRGTNAENLDYVGTPGELTVDTELNQIRLHDGSTVGGHLIGADNGDSDHGVDLFDTKWVDHILNDECWLRTETFSWQDGNMYTLAYNHLVEDIDGITPSTETVQNIPITYYQAEDGHKIIMPNQESYAVAIFEATGVAWYYILDTVNARFKLPRASNPGTAWYMPLSVAVSEYGANQQYLYMYIGNYKPAPSDNTIAILNEVNTKLDSIHNHGVVTVNQGNTQIAQFSLNQDEDITVDVQGLPGLPESTEDDYTRVVRVGKNGTYELGSEQFTPNLFDTKKSDYKLNDASWLCGDTFSWQYGSMYQRAYNHLSEDVYPTKIDNFTGTLSTVEISGPWYRKEYLDVGEFYFWENAQGNTVCTNTDNIVFGNSFIPGSYCSGSVTWEHAFNLAMTANILGTVEDVYYIDGAVEKTKYLKSNVTKIGNAHVSNDGLANGFATTVSYCKGSGIFTPTSSLEVVFKVHTPTPSISNNDIISSIASYRGMIIRLSAANSIKVWLSSNGTSWDIVSGTAYTCDLPINSDRWIKLTWDGSIYRFLVSSNGTNYTQIGTVSSTAKIYWNDGTFDIGGTSWESYSLGNGSIDLRNSYIRINGNTVWQGTEDLVYYEALDGHRIVLADQESNLEYLYEGGEDSWYYLLDIANHRFKLPRKKNRELVANKENPDGSWYKLYSDGWVEQGGCNNTASDFMMSFGLLITMRDTNYRAVVTRFARTGSGDAGSGTLDRRFAVTNNYRVDGFDAWGPNWGSVPQCYWKVEGYSAVDMSKYTVKNRLYFFVGNFTKTALENTAGVTAEVLNNKVDVDQLQNYVILSEFQAPTAENNYTWYKKYSNGWVEQGGIFVTNDNTAGFETTINLPVNMLDSNYTATVGVYETDNNANVYLFVCNKSTTTITLKSNLTASGAAGQQSWRIEGMAAQV